MTANGALPAGLLLYQQSRSLMSLTGVESGMSASETECRESSRNFSSALTTAHDPSFGHKLL